MCCFYPEFENNILDEAKSSKSEQIQPVYIIEAPSKMLLLTIVKVMATILRVIFQLTLSDLMNT